jgi:DNA-binding response OmpR family regulator
VDERSFRSYDGGAPAREPSVERLTASAPSSGSRADPSQQALLLGNLEIRPEEVQALADGRRVGLTVREFQVLLVLALREDRVVRRADIYGGVWGGEMKHRDRSVDVFVRKVRNKLAQAAPGWAYIHTHFGVGYRFAATPLSELAEPRPER